MILFEKFGQHRPLDRQAERYAKEGVPLSLRPWPTRLGPATPCWNRSSGALKRMSLPPSDCTAMTPPCRSWPKARLTLGDVGFMCATIVRSAAPRQRRRCSITRAIEPASILRHIRQLCRDCPGCAYSGYNKLYGPDRKPGPILEAACWAHARRPFFAMADLAENARRKAQGKSSGVISPLALEVVRRIDALFEIERSINGQRAEQRRAVRRELGAPLVVDLESWMRERRAKLSRGNEVAKAMEYMLKRWTALPLPR